MKISPIKLFVTIQLLLQPGCNPDGTTVIEVKESMQGHDFKSEWVDRLHDSPLQQKYKKMRPMPTGVVYVQHPGEGEVEIRRHFRKMKELGFNCLKQICTVDGWTVEQIGVIALEEGIIPWWFDDAGWEEITPELLTRLGIPPDTPMEKLRSDERMVTYQNELMKQALLKTAHFKKTHDENNAQFLRGTSVAYDPEVGGRGVELNPLGEKLFIEWCKKRYERIEVLDSAWNHYHIGLVPKGGRFTSWSDFEQRWKNSDNREFRNHFDILRFKVDHSVETLCKRSKEFAAFYPNMPFRAGGELGLFLPQASYCVDLESIADVMRNYGSFYPSIHLVWHYNEVNGETTRPFYMQSSLAADYFKGGWSGPWEATGGPQQISGESQLASGYTVDEGAMSQFIFSQIAAGFKGFGLWCWSARSAGLEVGEYSLLDRNNQVGERARQVGRIARAMQQYRNDLWDGQKEPVVGILTDWNNDAMAAVLSIKARREFNMNPMMSRVGIARALMNENVPWEHVTRKDLLNCLAPRYKVIYMPGMLTLSSDLTEILTDYVKTGGRLVMDMPGAMMDEYSRLFPTGTGSGFEKLFGLTLDDFQFSGFNRFDTLAAIPLHGCTVRATPTTASVLQRYNNGHPAVFENRLEKGSSVLIGYEASKLCFKPGNSNVEKQIVQMCVGHIRMPYQCKQALVLRLASAEADSYFLLNDQNRPVRATLTFDFYHYTSAIDAVSGEAVDLATVEIEANSGRWVRCIKPSYSR